MNSKTIVLGHDQVKRKLERIAHQLYEENHAEKELLLIGIAERGALLMERLAKRLTEISDLKISTAELIIDKEDPLRTTPKLSVDNAVLTDKVVVLVDDVLMSGRTLMHAAAHLVQAPLKKLVTVVLVDRMHRTFPIRADIVGLTLSTTLQEHISVELGKKDVVHLA